MSLLVPTQLEELASPRVVPRQLQHWATLRPASPFACCGDKWLSFNEMDRRSDALADRGVGKGDRVGRVEKFKLRQSNNDQDWDFEKLGFTVSRSGRR